MHQVGRADRVEFRLNIPEVGGQDARIDTYAHVQSLPMPVRTRALRVRGLSAGKIQTDFCSKQMNIASVPCRCGHNCTALADIGPADTGPADTGPADSG